MFRVRLESSRCRDSGQGRDDCHNSSSQLMAAGCWQGAELAGNRPSGSKTFSKRQDEEETRRDGSCTRESVQLKVVIVRYRYIYRSVV